MYIYLARRSYWAFAYIRRRQGPAKLKREMLFPACFSVSLLSLFVRRTFLPSSPVDARRPFGRMWTRKWEITMTRNSNFPGESGVRRGVRPHQRPSLRRARKCRHWRRHEVNTAEKNKKKKTRKRRRRRRTHQEKSWRDGKTLENRERHRL